LPKLLQLLPLLELLPLTLELLSMTRPAPYLVPKQLGQLQQPHLGPSTLSMFLNSPPPVLSSFSLVLSLLLLLLKTARGPEEGVLPLLLLLLLLGILCSSSKGELILHPSHKLCQLPELDRTFHGKAGHQLDKTLFVPCAELL